MTVLKTDKSLKELFEKHIISTYNAKCANCYDVIIRDIPYIGDEIPPTKLINIYEEMCIYREKIDKTPIPAYISKEEYQDYCNKWISQNMIEYEQNLAQLEEKEIRLTK